MIFDDLVFNADVDLCEVDQVGYVELRKAFETHTIPGNLEPDDMRYNDCDDPRSITGKPSDIFEAVQAGHQYADYLGAQAAASSSTEDESK